jgi:carbonic anhydrase
MSMAWLRTLVLCAGGTFTLTAPLAARAEEMSADSALKELIEGNKRYVTGKSKAAKLTGAARRAVLATTQKPYAIVLSCSDSRVPPEIIFDKGLGEIFVVRVAGNIPDPVIIGSIEYAAEHLKSPLVVVLGHERCGAVTASVDAKGKAPGNIASIVEAISPAVTDAKKTCPSREKAELVECAVTANVKRGEAQLTKKSPVLKHLVEKGELRIVGAVYDLDDGKVTVLKEAKEAEDRCLAKNDKADKVEEKHTH